METRELKTSTGYVATLKSSIIYGEWIKLQRILGTAMKIDPDTQKPLPMTGEAVFDANEQAVEFVLVGLKDKEGNDLLAGKSNKMDAIKDLDVSAGSEIMTEISAIWQKQLITQKKGI